MDFRANTIQDVAALNTEPRQFPFALSCRSPKHWDVVQKEALEAQSKLRLAHTEA